MPLKHYSRRKFLKTSIAGSSALYLSQVWAEQAYRPSRSNDYPKVPNLGLSFQSPELEPFVDPLPVPPKRKLGGTISIAEARHKFHRDLPAAPSWAYDGMTHFGPTIETHVSDDIVTTFQNNLSQHILADDIDTHVHGASEKDRSTPPTSVHLHGAPNRPEDDGHPLDLFYPKQKKSYRFRNTEEACHLWYHDHAMGTTRLSVYAGLAGTYLVRDDFDTGKHNNPLGLPAEDYEIPLMINDKVLKRDGSLRYQGTPLNPQDVWAGGLCGDLILVNGKVWPFLKVDRGVYRFRVLNATQFTDYRLALSNHKPFWVIGSDGGLLNKPCLVQELEISCGERYDILIDFSKLKSGEKVQLLNTIRIAWAGQLVGAVTVPHIMQFEVNNKKGMYQNIPSQLRGGKNLPAALPTVYPAAAISSNINKSKNIRRATFNTGVDLKNIRWVATGVMNINNIRFHNPDFDKPKQGTSECWEFINCDVLFQHHAAHVHLIQFRVIDRQDIDVFSYVRKEKLPGTMGTRWNPDVTPYLKGASIPLAPYETGWKDTVRCPPGQVTRVEVYWPTEEELGFDPDKAFSNNKGDKLQGYVWHCHLLDHEDHEMMQQFRLIK